MDANAQTGSVSKKALWAGYIVSALPVLMLLFSGVLKLAKPEMVVSEFTRLGWPENVIIAFGVVEIACAILYVIPQTAVLGAILLTGYLGGAIATHLRIGDPFIGPIVFGVLIWLGLFLRDSRVRALIPLRMSEKNSIAELIVPLRVLTPKVLDKKAQGRDSAAPPEVRSTNE